uniref:G_PROTEIN_RECEP_F1_2 domain-containing protein n=1 Tax=Strongyloides papillosus TaxID=174720 RepID=A0A0N5BCL5_STREA
MTKIFPSIGNEDDENIKILDNEELEKALGIMNNFLDNNDINTSQNAGFTIFTTLLYATLALLGFIGNLIFCLVIWKSEKLHTVTHMLMTNLAVCNLLFVLFHPPFFVTTYILQTNWIFGNLLCKASNSIVYITATGSFYFMSLVAIDRWLAIFCRRARLDRSRCFLLTIIVWLIAIGVSFPYLYYSAPVQVGDIGFFDILPKGYEQDIGSPKTQCAIDCQDCHRTLQLVTIVAQYCIPLAIMIPSYSHLAIYLWKRPTIGIQTKERCKKAQIRKRRLLITLLAIVGSLIICWSPLFSVGVLHSYNVIKNDSLSLYIYTSMVALFGVFLTPCFYLLNDGFRQQTLLFLPCLFPGDKESKKQSSATPCEHSHLEKHTKLKDSYNEDDTTRPTITPLLRNHSQSSRLNVIDGHNSFRNLSDNTLSAV